MEGEGGGGGKQVPLPVPMRDTVLCKHYLVTETKFTSKVTVKVNFIINGDPCCNTKNVTLSMTCYKCKDKCLRVQASDIKTEKTIVIPIETLMKNVYILNY